MESGYILNLLPISCFPSWLFFLIFPNIYVLLSLTSLTLSFFCEYFFVAHFSLWKVGENAVLLCYGKETCFPPHTHRPVFTLCEKAPDRPEHGRRLHSNLVLHENVTTLVEFFSFSHSPVWMNFTWFVSPLVTRGMLNSCCHSSISAWKREFSKHTDKSDREFVFTTGGREKCVWDGWINGLSAIYMHTFYMHFKQ